MVQAKIENRGYIARLATGNLPSNSWNTLYSVLPTHDNIHRNTLSYVHPSFHPSTLSSLPRQRSHPLQVLALRHS